MLSINKQDIKVAEYLKANHIKYTVISTQIGAKNDDNWQHDKWLIIFQGQRGQAQSFEYMTGTGHRVDLYEGRYSRPSKNVQALKKLLELVGVESRDVVKETKEMGIYKSTQHYKRTTPPTQASVLYGLFIDSDAATETFANWCDNYGYDTDSMKAQKIYFACQENANKLNMLFSTEQRKTLTKLLEDY